MFWAHHGPGLFYAVGNLIWLLLLGLLIGSLVSLLIGRRNKVIWGPPYPPPGGVHFKQPLQAYPYQPQLTPLQILQQRYARGEIDAATFEQMRERLEASERPPQ